MEPHLFSAAVQLHHEDLLREAEHARLVASMREPHAWRHRVGGALIRAGRLLAEEPDRPAGPVARSRARVA
jgi:hypothetical protein